MSWNQDHNNALSGGTYMAFWRLYRNALRWFLVVLAWVHPTLILPRQELHAQWVTISHFGEFSWTFMKVLHVKMTHFWWIILNFMNCPTRWLCQFNIVHFHKYSWMFMKVHELSWIFMKIWGLFSSTFMKFHESSWNFSAG